MRGNPELKWCDTSRRGYMAMTLTPDSATNDWIMVDTIKASNPAGQHRLQRDRPARAQCDGLTVAGTAPLRHILRGVIRGAAVLRVTIKDVSRVSGVSIKTVSRVLNKERYVGAETRARVEAAVAELNFRPSMAARSLAGKRSFQIALICDNPSPYYVYEMQSGIRDRCALDGVRMIAQPYDRNSPTLLDDIENLVEATHVDGLILTPPVSDYPAVLDLLARRRRALRAGLAGQRRRSRAVDLYRQ